MTVCFHTEIAEALLEVLKQELGLGYLGQKLFVLVFVSLYLCFTFWFMFLFIFNRFGNAGVFLNALFMAS